MIVYIDMDDVLCDFKGEFDKDLKLNPGIKFPQSQYGFFTKLPALDGAISAVNDFIQSKKYEPYILTAPSVKNPLSYTEKRVWIEKMFGLEFSERLILCSNKALLKGDYLIDDNNQGKGQENFSGTFIHFGSEGFPDWKSITKYFFTDNAN